MMNCCACQFEIEEVETGRALSEEARAHLSSCPRCRRFQDERFKLRSLLGALPEVVAPADFDFRLRARIAATKSAERNGHLFWRAMMPGTRAFAIAASVALLITAAFVFKFINSSRTGVKPNPQVAKIESPASAPAQVDEKGETQANQTAQSSQQVSGTNNEKKQASSQSETKNLFTQNPRVERFNRRPETFATPHSTSQPVASDSAVSAALVFKRSQEKNPLFGEAGVVSLPVRVTVPPLKVFSTDRRGSFRTVSLKPVTFGSQDLFERSGSAQKILVSNGHGIW